MNKYVHTIINDIRISSSLHFSMLTNIKCLLYPLKYKFHSSNRILKKLFFINIQLYIDHFKFKKNRTTTTFLFIVIINKSPHFFFECNAWIPSSMSHVSIRNRIILYFATELCKKIFIPPFYFSVKE